MKPNQETTAAEEFLIDGVDEIIAALQENSDSEDQEVAVAALSW